MKGFSEVSIQNRPCIIAYRGEHYVVRWLSGRTTRMAKADIIKKFHLHANALDRYIGGGFKKRHCNANEDVIRVKQEIKKVIAILLIVVMAVIVVYRQPRMVEISYTDDTETYVNYIDNRGDLYKDVYIEDTPLEVQIVAELR